MQASYIIDLDQFNTGKADFDKHYCLENFSTNINGKDIPLDWEDLYTEVQSFSVATGISYNEIALRFIHNYDINENEFYLRLQLCKLEETEETSHDRPVYNVIINQCAWYEIHENSIMSTVSQQDSGHDYLFNLYYSAEDLPGSTIIERLADDNGEKFVRTVIFPWWQAAEMYANNESPENAKVHFVACSYNPQYTDDAGVAWPHGLVLYLSVDNSPLLNNTVYTEAFKNKAMDHGQMIPPPYDLQLNDRIIYVYPNV